MQLKIIGAFLISFRFVSISFAQDIGLKAGANISTGFSQGQIDPYVLGVNAGVLCDVPVNKYFFISSGLQYSTEGNHASGTDVLRMNYLSLPILGGYKIGNHLEVLLGIEGGYLVSAVVKSGSYSMSFLDEFRRIDIGFNGSVRYRISDDWGVDLSCVRGLVGTMNPTQKVYFYDHATGMVDGSGTSHISEKDNAKNQSFQLSVLFFFHKYL